ncbi:MAG: DNRLRE domain-containing protein [Candidatus Eisenbacteria bacterium]|nr:DNRLRE domain-containing protein [Candidatus Eisenbacteria bacterium]
MSHFPRAPRRIVTGVLTALLACSVVSTGGAQTCPTCVPLDDPSGPPHAGFPLGLYPGSSNTPPAAHLTLALDAASQVVPRNSAGAPDPAGWIGWISIGMSNTNQEWSQFERNEDIRAGRNPRLITVDCAVSGKSADVIQNPADPYWTVVNDRILAAGLTNNQVQVLWLKEADGTVPDTSFPNHALTLKAHLRTIVQHLKDTFPNLQLCYLSTRIYGGYSSAPARWEPLSYETGFGVRWMIEEQIGGDPALNADPALGVVEAPVLLWGPYLWANGATPRASDGLTWLVTDYEGDHIHPALSGEWKVANLMTSFLLSDPTCAPWRDAPAGIVIDYRDATHDAFVDDATPATNYGTFPYLNWANPLVRTYARFNVGSLPGTVVHAKLSLKVPAGSGFVRGEVAGVSNTSWLETTITSATAPPIDGPTYGVIPPASTGSAVSLDVTSAVQAAIAAGGATAKISFAFRNRLGNQDNTQVSSKESADPPRLLLSLTTGTASTEEQILRPELTLEAIGHPWNGGGTVQLSLARAASEVRLEVFDPLGRQLRTLGFGEAPAGTLPLSWDGHDARGVAVPRGLYLIRATAIDGLGQTIGSGSIKVVAGS